MAIDWILRDATKDSDIWRILDIRTIAFPQEGHFVQAIQPRLLTPEGRASLFKETRRIQSEDATARIMVVEHPDTGEVVCYAQWHFHSGGDPGPLYNFEYLKDFEGTDVDFEKCRFIMTKYFEMRRNAVKQNGGPIYDVIYLKASKQEETSLRLDSKFVVLYFAVALTIRRKVLSVLMTDPAWHRKGAGRKALQWGLDQIDKDGAEGWLEGSAAGQKLYTDCGFVAEERYTVDLPPDKDRDDSPKVGPMKMRRPIMKKA